MQIKQTQMENPKSSIDAGNELRLNYVGNAQLFTGTAAGSVPSANSLVVCSSSYGIAFFALQQEIKAISTQNIPDFVSNFENRPPIVACPVPLPVTGIHLNCNESLLAVVAHSNTHGSFVYFYEIGVFNVTLEQPPRPVADIRLTSAGDDRIVDFQFNPTTENVFACISSTSRTLSIREVKLDAAGGFSIHADITNANAGALCWSPKGKQLCFLTCDNTFIVQINPNGGEARRIELPPGAGLLRAASISTSNCITQQKILWLATYEFLICTRVAAADDTTQPSLIHVIAPKDSSKFRMINFGDLCYGSSKNSQYAFWYSSLIPQWGLLLLSTSSSVEVAVLKNEHHVFDTAAGGQQQPAAAAVNKPESSNWRQLLPDDTCRAELPPNFDNNGITNLPCGLALDFCYGPAHNGSHMPYVFWFTTSGVVHTYQLTYEPIVLLRNAGLARVPPMLNANNGTLGQQQMPPISARQSQALLTATAIPQQQQQVSPFSIQNLPSITNQTVAVPPPPPPSSFGPLLNFGVLPTQLQQQQPAVSLLPVQPLQQSPVAVPAATAAASATTTTTATPSTMFPGFTATLPPAKTLAPSPIPPATAGFGGSFQQQPGTLFAKPVTIPALTTFAVSLPPVVAAVPGALFQPTAPKPGAFQTPTLFSGIDKNNNSAQSEAAAAAIRRAGGAVAPPSATAQQQQQQQPQLQQKSVKVAAAAAAKMPTAAADITVAAAAQQQQQQHQQQQQQQRMTAEIDKLNTIVTKFSLEFRKIISPTAETSLFAAAAAAASSADAARTAFGQNNNVSSMPIGDLYDAARTLDTALKQNEHRIRSINSRLMQHAADIEAMLAQLDVWLVALRAQDKYGGRMFAELLQQQQPKSLELKHLRHYRIGALQQALASSARTIESVESDLDALYAVSRINTTDILSLSGEVLPVAARQMLLHSTRRALALNALLKRMSTIRRTITTAMQTCAVLIAGKENNDNNFCYADRGKSLSKKAANRDEYLQHAEWQANLNEYKRLLMQAREELSGVESTDTEEAIQQQQLQQRSVQKFNSSNTKRLPSYYIDDNEQQQQRQSSSFSTRKNFMTNNSNINSRPPWLLQLLRSRINNEECASVPCVYAANASSSSAMVDAYKSLTAAPTTKSAAAGGGTASEEINNNHQLTDSMQKLCDLQQSLLYDIEHAVRKSIRRPSFSSKAAEKAEKLASRVMLSSSSSVQQSSTKQDLMQISTTPRLVTTAGTTTGAANAPLLSSSFRTNTTPTNNNNDVANIFGALDATKQRQQQQSSNNNDNVADYAAENNSNEYYNSSDNGEAVSDYGQTEDGDEEEDEGEGEEEGGGQYDEEAEQQQQQQQGGQYAEFAQVLPATTLHTPLFAAADRRVDSGGLPTFSAAATTTPSTAAAAVPPASPAVGQQLSRPVFATSTSNSGGGILGALLTAPIPTKTTVAAQDMPLTAVMKTAAPLEDATKSPFFSGFQPGVSAAPAVTTAFFGSSAAPKPVTAAVTEPNSSAATATTTATSAFSNLMNFGSSATAPVLTTTTTNAATTTPFSFATNNNAAVPKNLFSTSFGGGGAPASAAVTTTATPLFGASSTTTTAATTMPSFSLSNLAASFGKTGVGADTSGSSTTTATAVGVTPIVFGIIPSSGAAFGAGGTTGGSLTSLFGYTAAPSVTLAQPQQHFTPPFGGSAAPAFGSKPLFGGSGGTTTTATAFGSGGGGGLFGGMSTTAGPAFGQASQLPSANLFSPPTANLAGASNASPFGGGGFGSTGTFGATTGPSFADLLGGKQQQQQQQSIFGSGGGNSGQFAPFGSSNNTSAAGGFGSGGGIFGSSSSEMPQQQQSAQQQQQAGGIFGVANNNNQQLQQQMSFGGGGTVFGSGGSSSGGNTSFSQYRG